MTDRAPVHELRALTGVRGIAAWFVVFYHIRLSIAGLPTGVRDVFAKGYLAVDFFFLLSGFVIWLTWSERIRSGGLASVPRFLQKRIARIWPLHLVTLGGAVVLALVLRATGRSDPQFVFPELPLHILLLQNWGFTRHLAWNDPAWSISAELGAYLLFPLLVIAVDWRRWPSVALLATAGALLLGLHLVMSAPTLGTDIPRYGLLRCLVEFTIGRTVCALWLRWRDLDWAPVCAAMAAMLLARFGSQAHRRRLSLPRCSLPSSCCSRLLPAGAAIRSNCNGRTISARSATRPISAISSCGRRSSSLSSAMRAPCHRP
ncbi:acyltransferase [Sphingomonas sp. ZB1N12]|uniref:acyltransferase family protein n=1 Tax=Sphingomonas arabinosi TaxID=3096160 RepID=UPI002FC582C8